MRTKNTIPMTSLVVLAAMPAVALGSVWQLAERSDAPAGEPVPTTPDPPPPVDELATNLISPRRHPAPIADRIAAAEQQALTEALADDLSGLLGDGMCVTIRRSDDLILDIGGEQALIPASNMKVLVAAVALDVLGPEYRFRTELRSAPPNGSVVTGDVYVTGGGDPVLVSADHVDPARYPAINTTPLDTLIDQLVTIGITRIDGDIVGDATRYDDEFRVPSWGDDITNADAGPYDALLINDGLLDNGDFGLVPAQSAANIVIDEIEARGIDVTGSSRHAAPPDGLELTTLALVESQPLTEVLVELLHTSDNTTAEMIIKEIGFQQSGQGTRPAGAAAIAARLADWGISTAPLVLDDGSGLSRQNRLTCDALSLVVAAAPVAEQLWDLLPVAGRDGTLAEQLVGTAAEGEMQAKTGTLTGVKALTGVLDGADDEPVQFAMILNGEGVNEPDVYQAYWLELVELIGAYPIVVEPRVDRFDPR
jgi:D-alanyl-D-alanine carboxypeptidase/D-alanyl-D-alanine-endopeptidase (penicillin-binding protein 4)